MLLKRWLNKMEVFEKLLDSELYSYFKNASFYENPVFHTAHKTVDFYIEFENVIPLDVYERIITKLQLALHAHVKYFKIYMKKWSKPFNNFLIIKKDIIKF